ncbi:MAG: EF-hand domain-containing protein [Verrucomicrobiota bacterium]
MESAESGLTNSGTTDEKDPSGNRSDTAIKDSVLGSAELRVVYIRQADRDHDGKLTAAEWQIAPGAPLPIPTNSH